MTRRKNIIKAVRFERPDYIPMTFKINDACWQNYPQNALFDLMESHKLLFPDFERPVGEFRPSFKPVALKNTSLIDDWGCLWETREDGITGTVTRHPLADWSDFKNYSAPDPDICMGIGPIDWNQVAADLDKAKEKGELLRGKLRHGHTFLQLCDIRGYENLIFDMADNIPGLNKLIKIIEDFNMSTVKHYLDCGVEWMEYPEDLGMQSGPMISPDHFKKYIKPSYQRLMAPARKKETIVHMHSDGYLHELIDDIIDGGVDVINMQDLVNGIDWIAERFAGKTCIELDIDRQKITSKSTPKQIDALILEEVSKIGSKKGGLMMIYGLYPCIPLENARAVMDAMEKYTFYYS
ncbi:MAG: uroporphyrinogen decarboxylase family protein [bacterium]